MTVGGARRAVGAVMAALLLAALTSCSSGGSDGDASSTTTTTSTAATTSTTEVGAPSDAVAVDEWADGFCTSFEEWSSTISDADDGVGDDIEPGGITGARDAVTELFTTASEATGTLIEEIDAAGVPDVTDGDLLVDDLVERFQGFEEAIDDAATDAAALPVDQPETFRTELATLLETFKEETANVGTSFDQLDKDYPSAELKSALGSSCTDL